MHALDITQPKELIPEYVFGACNVCGYYYGKPPSLQPQFAALQLPPFHVQMFLWHFSSLHNAFKRLSSANPFSCFPRPLSIRVLEGGHQAHPYKQEVPSGRDLSLGSPAPVQRRQVPIVCKEIASGRHRLENVHLQSDIEIDPDPRQGHFFPGKKEGFQGRRSPTPISPRPGKGSFLSKNPISLCSLVEKRGFLTENSFSTSCEGEGKLGFSDPETLFSRKKWGFGALSGVGGIPTLI